MINQNYHPEFKEAFNHSLSPGETCVEVTDAYTEQWGKVQIGSTFLDQFQGFNWFSVGLTNINVRVFGFKVETTGGIFKKTSSVVPEIVGMNAIPIRNISSFGHRQFQPVKAVKKAHSKNFGTEVGDICAINIQYANGYLDCGSPYLQMASLAANLEAILSGTSLAAQASTTADAISRLAVLLEEGVLSPEEFERAKQGFVGATVEIGESASSTIRQLHSLFKAGVLTQSEFNMKKWDVLSKPW